MGKRTEEKPAGQRGSFADRSLWEEKDTLTGSISLFFALVFFLILALLFGLLESSRIYGLYANAYAKSELGVISAYSNYAAEPAEEFGILMFWEDGGTMEDTLLSCLQKQTQGEDNLILSLSSPSVEVAKKVYLTDEGGIYFLKQVAELVPYRIAGEALDDILTLSDIRSQMAVINEFTQMLGDAQENFADIGEVLEQAESGVNAVRELQSALEDAMDSVKTAAAAVEDLAGSDGELFQTLLKLWEEEDEAEEEQQSSGNGGQGENGSDPGSGGQGENGSDPGSGGQGENGSVSGSGDQGENGSVSGSGDQSESDSEDEEDSIGEKIEMIYARLEASWDSVRVPYETTRETLLQLVQSVRTAVSAAVDSMEAFESLQETATEALDNMEELLNTWKDQIPSSVYSELADQVRNMRETFTITETDTYGRVKLKAALQKTKELADSLAAEIRECDLPEFSEVAESIRGMAWEEAEQYLKDLAGQAGSGLQGKVLEFTQAISEIIYERADPETSDADTEGLSAGLLESIANLADNGVLALVLEDAGSVSGLTASLREFPSMTSKTTGSEQRAFLKSARNRAIMAAYGKLYFGSYQEPASDSLLAYEMEYILGGSASDRTNLTTVMGEIFLIREGLNYASLLADSAKMQEAGAAALAIATAAGLPILKIPIQLLLLAAWAAAESVCDLQQLYRGESVSLIKTSDSWNVSLENLAGVAEGTIRAGQSESTEKSDSGFLSFDYETYLLILLLLQDGQTQTWRMMDVLQMRMQKSARTEFCIKDCVVYTEGTISYRSAALFSDSWVLKQLLSVPSDYTIDTAFSYGYVE